MKRILLEGLGWILVLIGIAALILPGPGLLCIFAGMVLLSTQYKWAERRVEPLRAAALKTARESVQSWPRILFSSMLALALVALGIFWGISPDSPSWWPMADRWWLTGGWSTGAALILSGILALAMIIYSYRKFRSKKAKQ